MHAVKTQRALLWAIIGMMFIHLPIGAPQCTQLCLVRERGFELSETNSLYGSLFLVFGVLGMLWGGILRDWLTPVGVTSSLTYSMLCIDAVSAMTIVASFVASVNSQRDFS